MVTEGTSELMRQMTLEQQQMYSAISDAPDKPDLAQNLFRIGRNVRLRLLDLHGDAVEDGSQRRVLIIETNAPAGFYEGLDEIAPPKDCYVYDAARCTVLPLDWAAEQIERQFRLINSSPPPSLFHYLAHGFTGGLVIPLSSLDGSRHIVRFDGARGPLTQVEINDLTMLALHFFQSYDRKPLSVDGQSLRADRARTGDRPLDGARQDLRGNRRDHVFVRPHRERLYEQCGEEARLREPDAACGKALRMRVIS